MSPSDVAGVFSRYFIVGFFLPAFFALAIVAFGLSSDAVPNQFESYGDGAKIAIVGGAAVLLGLALLGLNYQVLRAFEGYPIAQRKQSRLLKPLHEWLMRRQHARYDALVLQSEAEGPDADEAAWVLDRYFSQDPAKRLLPTAFGNVVRAFERSKLARGGSGVRRRGFAGNCDRAQEPAQRGWLRISGDYPWIQALVAISA